MKSHYKEFDYYPSREEIEGWISDIWNIAANTRCEVEFLDSGFTQENIGVRHIKGITYMRFIPEGREPFYGYWQPAQFGKAPLLIHIPGGGSEMSMHPDLVMQGFNVLHVSPLGYMTNKGVNVDIRTNNYLPPCLLDTISSRGQGGFKQFLIDCCIATEWARRQEKVYSDRFGFFGTSQGGIASLLLGSIYSDKGVKCIASEEPFGTNFPMNRELDISPAYRVVLADLDNCEDPRDAWHSIGYLETLCHAHRLTFPVFLAAGGADTLCPTEGIRSLFDSLPSTKIFYYMDGLYHDYTVQFINMIVSWFKMYL